MAKYEEIGDFADQDYEKILFEEVYTRYLCRLSPWPKPVLGSFYHLNKQVYLTMQGPNEFTVTGNFKTWDRWNDLGKIQVLTLLISGCHDTKNPKDIEKIGSLIPHSKVKICENGSHLSMYDDQEAYFQSLHGFLTDVEKMR